ncbi:hypothetical protein Nmel_009500 [Mimus melanotis]
MEMTFPIHQVFLAENLLGHTSQPRRELFSRAARVTALEGWNISC